VGAITLKVLVIEFRRGAQRELRRRNETKTQTHLHGSHSRWCINPRCQKLHAKIIWPEKEIRKALPSIPPERKSPNNAVENGQGEEGRTEGDTRGSV
jgi:hypothetical protein